MDIRLPAVTPEKTVEILAKKLSAELIIKGAEHYLYLPESIGNGYIKAINFENGVGLLNFECIWNDDVNFIYSEGDNQLMRMLFCIEGKFTHTLKPNSVSYDLGSLKGSISSCSATNNEIFKFSGGEKCIIYCLEINKDIYFDKIRKNIASVSKKLEEVIGNKAGKDHFLYENDYNLIIAEVLNEINKNNFEGLIRRVYLEAKVLELISYQLKQYGEDFKPLSERHSFRKQDIDQLVEAKQVLLNDLREPPRIKELAKLVGTNENKLKKGFKKLFGITINNFITDKRLEKASILLAEEQLPVKEISEKVGYKSTSAFTKVFKNKYGVTPRRFLKRYSI